jgi:hypothetical protein
MVAYRHTKQEAEACARAWLEVYAADGWQVCICPPLYPGDRWTIFAY